MAMIDIHHAHTLPDDAARQAVEDVAVKLGRKFGLDYRWEGDALHFVRPGVDGHIAVLSGQLRVTAKLGLVMSAMKGTIESRIRQYLDEEFGQG
ncbi:MAG TPA: polyhydroxyalkanoic acid system family protein [Xanthomonadaceae bacterium]|nr:polyhydroxyalkanoic acid system family protein [Xanthomonadaceae bacterium]